MAPHLTQMKIRDIEIRLFQFGPAWTDRPYIYAASYI